MNELNNLPEKDRLKWIEAYKEYARNTERPVSKEIWFSGFTGIPFPEDK